MQEQIERLRHHLSQALDVIQEADRERSELLSAVAHEIRTPTASILGYVEMLREETDNNLEEHQREYLEIIHKSGEHITQLLDDLQDLEEVSSGNLSLELDSVDVEALIEDVSDELYPIAQNYELTLRTEIADPLPPVRADENRLRQVLLNLVSNGLKFTEEGAVTVEAAPVGRSDETDTNLSAVRIRVIDSGIGIHPDFLPRVFERFSREKRTEHSGSGLGLTISKELVERMEGTIDVESTVGEGSTFTIVLPAESENGEND